MQKFLSEQKIKSLAFPSEGQGIFSLKENLSGSLQESNNNEDILELMAYARCNNLHCDYSISVESERIVMLPPHFNGTLTKTEVQQLTTIYEFIYPHSNLIHLSPFYTTAKKCVMANELFTTSNAREKSSVIMAYWPMEDSINSELQLQVGIIQQFLKHRIKVKINDVTKDIVHILCKVEWHIKHPQANWYGTSALLCTNMTHSMSAHSFMPIQRILHRRAYGRLEVMIPPRNTNEIVIVAIPVHLKYFI